MTAEGSNTFFSQATVACFRCRAGTPIPAGQSQHRQPSEKRQKRAPALFSASRTDFIWTGAIHVWTETWVTSVRAKRGYRHRWDARCQPPFLAFGGGNRWLRSTRGPGINSRKGKAAMNRRSPKRAKYGARHQSEKFGKGVWGTTLFKGFSPIAKGEMRYLCFSSLTGFPQSPRVKCSIPSFSF